MRWGSRIANQLAAPLQPTFPQNPKTPQSTCGCVLCNHFQILLQQNLCCHPLGDPTFIHIISSVCAGTVVISDFLQPVFYVPMPHFPLALQLFVVNITRLVTLRPPLLWAVYDIVWSTHILPRSDLHAQCKKDQCFFRNLLFLQQTQFLGYT